jgi:hypothetical protein
MLLVLRAPMRGSAAAARFMARASPCALPARAFADGSSPECPLAPVRVPAISFLPNDIAAAFGVLGP